MGSKVYYIYEWSLNSGLQRDVFSISPNLLSSITTYIAIFKNETFHLFYDFNYGPESQYMDVYHIYGKDSFTYENVEIPIRSTRIILDIYIEDFF